MANQAGRLSLTFFAAAISLQGSTKNNGNSTGLKPWGSFGLEREKFTAALSCAGFQHPHLIVSVGAVTAMLGVALNLILGLSRVVLAMGRRADMPSLFAKVDSPCSPTSAIIAAGIAIGALALIGNVEITLSAKEWVLLELALEVSRRPRSRCVLEMQEASIVSHRER